jgi:hypothetical protein
LKQAWIQDTGPAEMKEETALLAGDLVVVKPVLATHPVICWKQLMWSLEMPVDVKCLDPAVMSLHKTFVNELMRVPEMLRACASRKLERVLKHRYEASRLLFVPGGAGGHWTLLAIPKKGRCGREITTIRCQSRAQCAAQRHAELQASC